MKIIIIVFFMTIAYIVGMSKFEQYMSLDQIKYNSNYQSYTINSNKEENDELYVSISGEVVQPKKVAIKEGTTLKEVIQQCGGLKPTADIRCINLNLLIYKSTSIYVPPLNLLVTKISINEASVEDFDSLPGIGQTYASRIVEYRSINGEFLYLEQLMEISGIGQTVFNKIKDLITL